MKHLTPVTIIDTHFLCEYVSAAPGEPIKGIVIYPGRKKQPLNDFLNEGAKLLLQRALENKTGYECTLEGSEE